MGTSNHFVLRELPLASRLVLSAFLVSIGVGYCSALVQLHFQHATPGQVLPGADEARKAYGLGDRPQSHVERLLETPEGASFNGTGTMRPAFTTKSDEWKKLLKKKKPAEVEAIQAEREGERLAFLEWVRAGAKKAEYDKDEFPLPAALATQPVTDDFLAKDADGRAAQPRRVLIKSLIEKRCVDCHQPDDNKARMADAVKFPLDTYERLKPYLKSEATAGMSLTKLAQTTHVHLLGLSLVYGLTGLIFSFTSYPGWLRAVVGPLPLLAQLADISCWWLARFDGRFAQVIMVTGGLVAVGLFLQIVLGLFNMYDRHGKKVVVLLLLLGAAGGFVAKTQVVDPYLEQEKSSATAKE